MGGTILFKRMEIGNFFERMKPTKMMMMTTMTKFVQNHLKKVAKELTKDSLLESGNTI